MNKIMNKASSIKAGDAHFWTAITASLHYRKGRTDDEAEFWKQSFINVIKKELAYM